MLIKLTSLGFYYRRHGVEQRTARLTLLIDPKKKSIFDELCAKEDVTASQKVRQFIRDYIEQQLGPDWQNSVLVGDDETKDIKR
ncbi:hypothetical protein KO528_02045 [Saccharophagus degradans]|nr:hypothetical protein [Saccharophagus degradans]MBU2984120.1 hypothetical protein [Saccharophagus degradans]